MIYKELDTEEFIEEIQRMGYGGHFTSEGLCALYDFHNSIGNVNFSDVIAACDYFEEYESINDFIKDYSNDYKSWGDVRKNRLVLELKTGGALVYGNDACR